MGIKGRVLEWVTNFLTGRKQRVQIKGETSEWVMVLSGVPQGSVMGSVLFLIYINNIVINIDSTIKLFADDAKIYRTLKSPNDTGALQQDLKSLENWSKKWLLKFNESKVKVIHFGHSNPKVQYIFNSRPLEISQEENDLGINVTDN